MAAAKENNAHHAIIIKSTFVLLALVVIGITAYLYWQDSENRKRAELQNTQNKQQNDIKTDRTRVSDFNKRKEAPALKSLNLDAQGNATLDNAKIVSVNAAANQIVVLDQNSKELPLTVTNASRMQKIVTLSAEKKVWQHVSIQEVPKGVNATVVFNKNHEIVYLTFVSK